MSKQDYKSWGIFYMSLLNKVVFYYTNTVGNNCPHHTIITGFITFICIVV